MDDALIVEKTLEHKENFKLIVQKYQVQILNYLYSWTWNKQFAEDLTQETFIALFNNLNSFDKSKSLQAWLFTIARNKAIDWLRKNKTRRQSEVPLQYDLADKDNKDISDISIEKQKIRQMTDQLKQIYKEVLLMFYWQELSYKEISQILKISINTVKTRLRRAKDKLKVLLQNEGFEKFTA